MIGTVRRRGLPTSVPWTRSLRIAERVLVGALGDATPCSPTEKRAAFIMMNMYSRPRFSSPTR